MITNFWKPKKGKELKPTHSAWRTSMNKPAKAFYGDSDGDGVMNMFDCQPHNKKKQGDEHEEWSKKDEYKYSQGALVRKRTDEEKREISEAMKAPRGHKPSRSHSGEYNYQDTE